MVTEIKFYRMKKARNSNNIRTYIYSYNPIYEIDRYSKREREREWGS